MKSIRVIAVGLIISSFLVYGFAIDFYKWVLNESLTNIFLLGINTISPKVTDASGMKNIVTVAYVIICLGIGMLMSSTIFSNLETFFSNIYRAYINRDAYKDYQDDDLGKYRHEQMQKNFKKYFGWLPKRYFYH